MKRQILSIFAALIVTPHASLAAKHHTASAPKTDSPTAYFFGKVWSLSVFDSTPGDKYGQWQVNITEDGATESTSFIIPGNINTAAITTMTNLLITAYVSQQRVCISYQLKLITGVYYPADAFPPPDQHDRTACKKK